MQCGLIDGLELDWKSSAIFGGSAPIRLSIHRVFLLIGPRDEAEDEKEEEEESYSSRIVSSSSSSSPPRRRRRRLAKFESMILASSEGVPPPPRRRTRSSSDAGEMIPDAAPPSFWDRLTRKLLDDLVVTIRQVHIRYEDNHVSDPRRAFSCGFKLESVVVCNEEEEDEDEDDDLEEDDLEDDLSASEDEAVVTATTATTSTTTTTTTTKRATLQQLSAYWDPHLGGSAFDYTDHHYVLQPLNATVRYESSSTTSSRKVVVDVGVSSLSLTLEDRQFREALSMYGFCQEHALRRLYRERARAVCHVGPLKRPIRRGATARRWWRFARAALMGPAFYRRTGAYIVWRRRTRLEYCDLWVRSVSSSGFGGSSDGGGGGESTAEAEKKKEIDPEIHPEENDPEEEEWWFQRLAGGFLGGASSSSSGSSSASAPVRASPDLRRLYEELSRAIDYSSAAASSSAITTSTLLRFTLKSGSVGLASSSPPPRSSGPPPPPSSRPPGLVPSSASSSRLVGSSAPFLEAHFDMLTVDLASSSSLESPSLKLRLEDISIVDRCAPPSSVFSKIVGLRRKDGRFLDMEVNPHDGGTSLTVGAVDVVYLPQCLVRLERFLASLRSWSENGVGESVGGRRLRSVSRRSSQQMVALWREVESAAMEKLEALKARTQQRLRELLGGDDDDGAKGLIDIHIEAPRVVVPEDPRDRSTTVCAH
eukprot:g4027.t1